MTEADALKADYRSFCLQTVIVRRYAADRTPTDAQCAGNARLYNASELVGTITQGDQRVIVLADDIATGGISLPLTTFDKVVVGGVEFAVRSPNERKALDGTLIAYEVQARGT
jgi:hypothetical protein